MIESYGVIGCPVAHSLSPKLHGLLYRQTGHPATYSRFEVRPEHIGQVIPAMRTLGIRGINVTSPHKEAILPWIDRMSDTAKAIGAVNTVLLEEDGGVFGDNTDSYGFAQSLLHSGVEIAGKRFVLCGQSGAGKAIRHALTSHGAAEITVASTRQGVGITYQELEVLPPKDVIINCTPLGMHPDIHRSVVEGDVLEKFSVAVDLIYSPMETKFLRLAAGRGVRTLSGLWMLVFQGIRSFELWTGIPADQIDAESVYKNLKAEVESR